MSTWIRRVILIQAAAALICFTVEAFNRFVLHLTRPFDCPIILNQGDRLPDFSLWLSRYDHLHSKAFFDFGPFPFMYPAVGALFYAPFIFLGPNRVLIFGLVLIATFVGAAALFGRALVHRGLPLRTAVVSIGLASVLSYPLWFELERGNIEMFVWATAALGVWAFYRGRGYSAAACFGLAGAAKMYALIYLGLFLGRHRQGRKIGFGILVAALMTLAALWIICPQIGFSIRGVRAGLKMFDHLYVPVVMPDVIGFDHSLFALCKRLLWPGHQYFGRSSRAYIFAVACIGTGLFFWRIRKAPLVNQVTALTVATVLFPPVSFDYTLLNLYTPVCLLLVVSSGSSLTRGAKWALTLFALIASPLTEFITHAMPWEGQLKALLLLTLFVVALVVPLQAPAAQELIPLQ